MQQVGCPVCHRFAPDLRRRLQDRDDQIWSGVALSLIKGQWRLLHEPARLMHRQD